VIRPGASRKEIAQTLNAAYADGLLSPDTFARRLDQLLDARLIDPFRLIGDLNLRRSRGRRMSIVDAVVAALPRVRKSRSREDDFGGSPLSLALDWSGGQSELTLAIRCVMWSSRTPKSRAGMLASSFVTGPGSFRISTRPMAPASTGCVWGVASCVRGITWFWATSTCRSTERARQEVAIA